MKEKRATLEVIAPTVEEAIAKGLEDLGLPEDAVEVEVLDQGSRGLFGLGSRQARIRLAVKGSGGPIEQEEFEQVEETVLEEFIDETEEAETFTSEDNLEVAAARREKPATLIDKDNDLSVAREVVTDLLEKMKVTARVTAHFGEADEERTRIPIMIDVRGDDLGILIGRRAEVLNALQYISGLIISKELGKATSIVIDVEGYRARREGQLRQLARRMADQAIKTGRRTILEPMPASERRIIHMELRDHPDVRTESIGEEPRRKVTIIPKE